MFSEDDDDICLAQSYEFANLISPKSKVSESDGYDQFFNKSYKNETSHLRKPEPYIPHLPLGGGENQISDIVHMMDESPDDIKPFPKKALRESNRPSYNPLLSSQRR